MNVPEDIKRQAANIGIKPGAVVKWVDKEPYTVPPYDKWYQFEYGDYAWLTEDGAPHDWCWIYCVKYPRFTPTVITPAPEDQPQGLVDGMACEPDEHMRAAIVAKSVEIGSSSGKHPIWGTYFYWDSQEYKLLQGDDTTSKPIPPGEFYDRLCKTVKHEPRISIGDYHVTFNKGSIQVGCTTVPNDIVRKVAERLKD